MKCGQGIVIRRIPNDENHRPNEVMMAINVLVQERGFSMGELEFKEAKEEVHQVRDQIAGEEIHRE